MQKEFNNTLKEYIVEKNINVSSMAKYINIDRSTLYKIINGKRNPSNVEMVKKIADFMILSPKETNILFESYYYSLIGKDKFEQFNEITDFFTSYNVLKTINIPIYKNQININDLSPILTIQQKINLNSYLLYFLELETQHKHPTIYINDYHNYTFLHDVILTIGKHNPNLTINHLLCFGTKQKQEIANLKTFKNILPYYTCECKYEAYYYYDNIESHFENYNFLSCQIITTNAVILYSSDLSQSQIITDQKAINQYKHLFERYISQSNKLFNRVNSIMDEYYKLGNIIDTTQQTLYAIHSEPCTIPYVSLSMYRKYVREDLPNRDASIQFFYNYSCNERKLIKEKKIHLFSTLEGIRYFIETGIIDEVPANFYNTIKKEDRIKIIQSIVDEIEQIHYDILKGDLTQISPNLHVCVGETTGYLLFKNVKNEFVYLYPNESHFIDLFYQYLSFLNENYGLYSKNEAKQLLQNLINEYK